MDQLDLDTDLVYYFSDLRVIGKTHCLRQQEGGPLPRPVLHREG